MSKPQRCQVLIESVFGSRGMMYSKIIGTGGYLPGKKITNHDLSKIVDTSDEWIKQRVGVEQGMLSMRKKPCIVWPMRRP